MCGIYFMVTGLIQKNTKIIIPVCKQQQHKNYRRQHPSFLITDTHSYIVPRDSFLEEIKPGQNVNCMIETGFIFWGMVFFITLAGLMVEWGELAANP